MASNLKTQRIIPPYLGLDTDSAPELLAQERAAYHVNWVLDRTGACVMRGPLLKTTNAGIAEQTAADPLIGAWGMADCALFTQSDGGASARVHPCETFWKYAASDAEIVQSPAGAGDGRSTDLRSGGGEAQRGIGGGAFAPWGNSHAFLANAIFAPTTRETAAGTVIGGHRRFNTGIAHIVEVAGGVDYSDTFVAANRPGYVVACESHYQRLFVCAAQDGTGMSAFGGYTTDYNPHQIYWTNPATSVTALISSAATTWRDAVSLQINKATVGAPGPDDACMGLASQDRNLMIFKRHSVYMMYGYGADTWNIRQLTDAFGCIDPRSIVKLGTDVYFMSQQGFIRYDGTRFTNVSGRLRSSLVRQAINRCGPSGTDGGFVWATPHRDGYIMVTVGTMNYQSGLSTVDFCGYYYPPFDSWSWFSSAAISTHDNWETGSTLAGGLLGFANTNNFSVGYTTDTYYDAQYLFFPEKAPTANYGRDQSGRNAANIQATRARFDSRLYNLASPLMQSKMQALFTDHIAQLNAGAEDSISPTTVTLLNGADTTLLTTTLGAAAAATTKKRRRHVSDVFTETEDMGDVQLRVEMAPSAALQKAQVYAADVLYQSSQERRSS